MVSSANKNYDITTTYYYKYHTYKEIPTKLTSANIFNGYKAKNNNIDLYYQDSTKGNKIIKADSYINGTDTYYQEITSSFDAENYLIRYLDNKNHEKITNKTKVNESLPCFNSDGWLLLKTYRGYWRESKGSFDYLYLTPEKYFIKDSIVYIYFIY